MSSVPGICLDLQGAIVIGQLRRILARWLHDQGIASLDLERVVNF